MKYSPIIPRWLGVAMIFLLASLATLSLKKPTFFFSNTNLNDLFLLLCSASLIIAYVKKEFSYTLPRWVIIALGIGLGSIILGTLTSYYLFHIVAPDAVREYVRIGASILTLINVFIIGIHNKNFIRYACTAIVASTLLLPVIIYIIPDLVPFLLDEYHVRFTGFMYDPNYFASFQILPTLLLLYFSFHFNDIKHRIIRIIPLLLFSISVSTIIWSGSRGGIAGLIGGIIALVIMMIYTIPFKKTWFFLGAIIIACSLSIVITPKMAWDGIAHRVQSFKLHTQPSSPKLISTLVADQDRGTLWHSALINIIHNPLGYGPGYGNTATITDGHETGNRVAHNTILQILLTGSAGLLLALCFSLFKLFSIIRIRKTPFGSIHYLIAAFIGISISGIFLDSLWSRFIWVIIGLILVELHITSHNELLD